MSDDVKDGSIQFLERKFAPEIADLKHACEVQAAAIAELKARLDVTERERDEARAATSMYKKASDAHFQGLMSVCDQRDKAERERDEARALLATAIAKLTTSSDE